MVTDYCATCSANQLNMPASTFLQHFGSSLTLGRVNVTFQQVRHQPANYILILHLKIRKNI